MKYQWKQRIRYSEVDGERKLTIPNLVNYFQDCSTFQSEELGVGCEYMEEHQKAWVLSFWQIVIERRPKLGEEVTVETFATGFDGLYGTRNFVMTDAKGSKIAYAYSIWVFMDLKKGRPVRPQPQEIAGYGTEEPLPMEYAGRKIPLPKERKQGEPFPVRRHQIDTNHHVNNGQYVQMAMEWVPEDFTIRQMRAEYKKQAVLGNMISPRVHAIDGVYTVALCDEQGEVYVIVEFQGTQKGTCSF